MSNVTETPNPANSREVPLTTKPNGAAATRPDPSLSDAVSRLERAAAKPAEAFVSREIPLAQIKPSPTNPRKTFDQVADGELMNSIREHGVLQPIVVRPFKRHTPNGTEELYEIVCGERRYRAAKNANLAAIPAVIRTLSDEQVLEFQIIENLQRKDVQPIEEGQGYRALIAVLAKADPKDRADGQGVRRQDLVEQIAKKVGKSARYVYARMKLCDLNPKIIELINQGELTASHGDLLARLTPAQQKEILEDKYSEGLFDVDADEDGKEVRTATSVRNLQETIERKYLIDLREAPFKLEDAALVAKAGACSGCPKNTLNDKLTYPDAKFAKCTDAKCYEAKTTALVQLALATAGKDALKFTTDYQERSKAGYLYAYDGFIREAKCESARPAVVVNDTHGNMKLGQTMQVCIDKKCKTHAGKQGTSSASSSRGLSEAEKKRQEKIKADQAKALQEEMLEAAGDIAVFEAVVPKVKAIGAAEIAMIAAKLTSDYFNDGMQAVGEVAIGKLVGAECPEEGTYDWLADLWRKQSAKWPAEKQLQFVIGLLIGEAIGGGEYSSSFTAKDLDEYARKYKLDPKAIRAKAVAAAKAAAAGAKDAPKAGVAKVASAKSPAVKAAGGAKAAASKKATTKSSPKKSAKKGGRK